MVLFKKTKEIYIFPSLGGFRKVDFLFKVNKIHKKNYLIKVFNNRSNLIKIYWIFFMKRLKVIFFCLITLPIISLSQTTNTSTGDGSAPGQTNVLGSNIGQSNTTNNISGGSGNTTNNNSSLTNIPTDTTSNSKVTSVPTMYAPGLTAFGSDICLGSISAAGSVLGFGISGGKTYVDDNCVMLKNSERLRSMGLLNASFTLLMENEKILAAVKDSTPMFYLQLMKDKVSNLQAEIEVAKEEGESTFIFEEQFKKYNHELKITIARIKANPEIQVSALPPQPLPPIPSQSSPALPSQATSVSPLQVAPISEPPIRGNLPLR